MKITKVVDYSKFQVTAQELQDSKKQMIRALLIRAFRNEDDYMTRFMLNLCRT